jgi:transcriptional regulator with XRE-family HTH domain
MIIEMNTRRRATQSNILKENHNTNKGRIMTERTEFSVYAKQNPYKYLVKEGNVRREYLDHEAIWSAEDVVGFLCAKEDIARLTRKFMQYSKDIENPLGIFKFHKSYLDWPTELSGSVVTDLLTFCRTLPGERAAEFTKLIEEYNERIAGWLAWIDENTPFWERRGARYRKARKALKISIVTAADNIGISSSEVGKFERGKPVKRAKMIEAMLGVFLELAILKKEQEEFMLLLDQARYPEDFGLEERPDEWADELY